MDKVRAKFVCDSKKEYQKYGGGSEFEFKFSPVMAHNSTGTDENKTFWKYTPAGELKMSCIDQNLFDLGQEYYLDFSKAPKEVEE